MLRSRPAALIAMTLVMAATSAAALCGLLACPHPVVRSGCHSAPALPSLSDCCAAHSPSAETGPALTEAAALPRTVSHAAAPALAAADATALAGEAPAGRRSAIPLFKLHRSLLL